MAGANSVFFAVAPYHGGGFSNGINDAEELRLLPDGYAGGISTDRSTL
jgi:glycerophosphoryl diester phosphodiesterase